MRLNYIATCLERIAAAVEEATAEVAAAAEEGCLV